MKIFISSCPFFLHHLCVFLLLSLRLPIRLSHSTYFDERGTVKYLPQVKNTKQHSLESMRTLCLLLLLYLGIGTDIFNHHRYPINEKQSLIVVIIINNIYWLILIQSNQSKTLTLSHRNVLIAMDYTQLLDAVFVISRITKVKVGLSAEAEADNPYQK